MYSEGLPILNIYIYIYKRFKGQDFNRAPINVIVSQAFLNSSNDNSNFQVTILDESNFKFFPCPTIKPKAAKGKLETMKTGTPPPKKGALFTPEREHADGEGGSANHAGAGAASSGEVERPKKPLKDCHMNIFCFNFIVSHRSAILV